MLVYPTYKSKVIIEKIISKMSVDKQIISTNKQLYTEIIKYSCCESKNDLLTTVKSQKKPS